MSVNATVTLNEDLAARLQEEMRRSGRTLDQILADALPAATSLDQVQPRRRFKIRARALNVRPGIDLRKTNRLLDELEKS